MKAVVLEIKNGEAAVLLKDGQVIRVPKQNLSVGDTLDIDDSSVPAGRFSPALKRRILNTCAAAASAALILGLGGGYWYTSAAACSYVSLDINPSIEYILNRRNQVIDIEALNDDASDIVDTLLKSGVIKSGLAEALQDTAELLESEGYIASDSETDYILVNISSGSKKSAKLLKNEVSAAFKDLNKEYEDSLSLTLTESAPSEHKKANELGISAGEYHEIKTIRENASGSDNKEIDKSVVREYQSFNVRELLDASGSLPETDNSITNSGSGEKSEQNRQQNSGSTSNENNENGAASSSSDNNKNASISGAQSGSGGSSKQDPGAGQKSTARQSSDTGSSGKNTEDSAAGTGNSGANSGTGNTGKSSGNSGAGSGNFTSDTGNSTAGSDNSGSSSSASQNGKSSGTDSANSDTQADTGNKKGQATDSEQKSPARQSGVSDAAPDGGSSGKESTASPSDTGTDSVSAAGGDIQPAA